ncbi:hypothetical protein H3V09_05165 [Bifidobacterium sp. M0399]|nr:hypothetical protein [Bifidobacterium sp. M0399]
MTWTDEPDGPVSTRINAGDCPIRPLLFSSYVIEGWRRNMLPAVACPGIIKKTDPQIFALI